MFFVVLDTNYKQHCLLVGPLKSEERQGSQTTIYIIDYCISTIIDADSNFILQPLRNWFLQHHSFFYKHHRLSMSYDDKIRGSTLNLSERIKEHHNSTSFIGCLMNIWPIWQERKLSLFTMEWNGYIHVAIVDHILNHIQCNKLGNGANNKPDIL